MTMPIPPVRLDDRSLLALMTASLWPAMVSSQIGNPRDDSVRIARELLKFVDQQLHAAATPENLTPFFDESCLGPGRVGRRVLDEDNSPQPAVSMPAIKMQAELGPDLLHENCIPFWTALRVGHIHDYVLVWTMNAIDNSPTEYGQRIVDALIALGGKSAPTDAQPVAWIRPGIIGGDIICVGPHKPDLTDSWKPLYSAPPPVSQPEWVHYGWALGERFLRAGAPLDGGSWVKVYVHPGQPYLAPPHSAATLPNDLPEIVVSAEGAETPEEFTQAWAESACDGIDAGFFSADTFHTPGNLARIEWYMARWQREIVDIKKMQQADPQQP